MEGGGEDEGGAGFGWWRWRLGLVVGFIRD